MACSKVKRDYNLSISDICIYHNLDSWGDNRYFARISDSNVVAYFQLATGYQPANTSIVYDFPKCNAMD